MTEDSETEHYPSGIVFKDNWIIDRDSNKRKLHDFNSEDNWFGIRDGVMRKPVDPDRDGPLMDEFASAIGDSKVIGPTTTDWAAGAPGFDEELTRAARFLLENATGLDVENPHGQKTPERFVRMLMELTTPEKFEFTTFPADGYDEMIVEEKIPFVSLCNHHIIPFTGYAYVGYIPEEKMAGLSKLARVVKYFAAGLQTQEQLTSQIAEALETELSPKGVAVLLRAEHFCMTIRGVKAPGALTTTSKMTGVFADHSRTAKAEFMSIIGGL